VVEAERLCEIVKIRMLKSQGPLREIARKITVSDCNLDSPIFFVVGLDMPMNFHRTHVSGAIQKVRLDGCSVVPGAYCWKIIVLCVPVRKNHSSLAYLIMRYRF
jgi:hypothetical protein